VVTKEVEENAMDRYVTGLRNRGEEASDYVKLTIRQREHLNSSQRFRGGCFETHLYRYR